MSKLNYVQAPYWDNKTKFSIKDTAFFKSIVSNSDKKFYLLLLINLAVTVFLSSYLNIWLDEAYSLNTTSKDLFYAIHQSLYFEFQPPLYFAVLTLWRDLNPSIFFARLFSVLSISMSIYLIPGLSRRYLPKVKPVWLTAVFALNPFTVWAAVEIRPYAFIILLSALLLIFFYDAYLSPKKTKFARWAYIALALIGLYTQYYIGFLLAANAGVLVVNKRWSDFRKYLIDMIIPAASLSFIIPQIMWQVNLNSGYNGTKENFIQGLRFIYRRAEEYIIPFNDYISGETNHWIFRAGVVGFFIYTLIPLVRNKFNALKKNKIYVWPVVLILSLIFSELLGFVGSYFLREKHTAVLFIPILIFFLSLISLNKNKKFIIAWVLFLIGFYSFALIMQYKNLAKPGDFIRVSNYIMDNESNNQPILIFRREMAIPLEYYYKGINNIVPIPKKYNFEGTYNYKESEWALKSEKEVANVISKIKNSPATFWLLTNQQYPIYGHSVNSKYLEDYVRKDFSVIKEKKFFGINLRLIKKNKTNADHR